MFTLKTSILAIGLLASSTLGFNSYMRAHCRNGHICFTSFVWCPDNLDESLGSGKSCTADDGVYPASTEPNWSVGAISAYYPYTISWSNPDDNYDVLIQLINVNENWTNRQVLWSDSKSSSLPVLNSG